MTSLTQSPVSANEYRQPEGPASKLQVQVDEHDIGTSPDLEKPESTHKSLNSESTSPCPSEHGDVESREKIVVSFDPDDKDDPYNFSRSKKLYIVITGMVMVLNSSMGSSIPAGTIGPIEKYFDIHNAEQLVLPVSIYLIGYVLGPLIFAPLSEAYGRKLVMISTFILFTAFVLACALAPTFASLVVFRLLAGIGASTPMSVIGGIYADIYKTPRARGIAINCFMAGTTWGPLAGPVVSGFVAVNVSWQWVYWVELIFAGATWPFLLLMPETYGPVLLRRKAKILREKTGDADIVAPADLEKRDFWDLVTVVLTRPIRMFLFEAIVLFSCLYLSLAYGIFYMFFQAFEPIFGTIYDFNPGEVGLCFLPIGVGAAIATGIYFLWDWYLDRTRAKAHPPAWSRTEEATRLPLACFGGPMLVISLFWLGWTARPDVHWIVPVMSALPFGIGFLLIFMALLNYVVDAYSVYAASAMGAMSATRSTFGVVLPFAARPLFSTLGVNWACTLLGLLSALMCLIPFAFLKYGSNIRENSKWCQELKRKELEEEEKQRSLQIGQESSRGDLEKQT